MATPRTQNTLAAMSRRVQEMTRQVQTMLAQTRPAPARAATPSPTPAPARAATPAPVQTTAPARTQTPTPVVSVVDYLKAQGQASDFASRSRLAQQHGISGYTGTADQNLRLLNILRETPTPKPAIGPTPPQPTVIRPTPLPVAGTEERPRLIPLDPEPRDMTAKVDPATPVSGTYTVKRGDSLSVIAARHGMTWQELHRANPQIRDPHLISPGQTITIPRVGARVEQRVEPIVDPRVGPRAEPKDARDEYRDFMVKRLEELERGARQREIDQEKRLQEMTDRLREIPSPVDVRKRYAEQLGIGQAMDVQAGIQRQVLDVEGLLDRLEGDIQQRIEGRLITDPHRRRIMAVEAKPLREQMADLMRAEARAGVALTGRRQELADIMRGYDAEQEREMGVARLPYEHAMRRPADIGLQTLPHYERLMKPEEKEEPRFQYFTNEKGVVTKYNPLTGQTVSLGKVGKVARAAADDEKEAKPDLSEARRAVTNFFGGSDMVQDPNRREPFPSPRIGADGYVSPTTWKKAKKAWVDDGLDPESFIDQFYMYINPAHPEDYGRKEQNKLRVLGGGGWEW